MSTQKKSKHKKKGGGEKEEIRFSELAVFSHAHTQKKKQCYSARSKLERLYKLYKDNVRREETNNKNNTSLQVIKHFIQLVPLKLHGRVKGDEKDYEIKHRIQTRGKLKSTKKVFFFRFLRSEYY